MTKTKATPSLASPEARDAEIIANAVRYTASLFLGRGKYANAEATSREAIDALAADLKCQHPKATALPILTAIDAAGDQATINGQPRKAGKRPASAAKPVKAAKGGKAAKAAPAPAARAAKPVGARAEIAAAAAAGTVPPAPDFSAATHKRFRRPLAELVALIEKGDVRALRSFSIAPVWSSRSCPDAWCS